MTKKYSVAEVAEVLGVAESKVHMAVTRGKLRGVNKGREWLFTFADLKLFLGAEVAKELFEENKNPSNGGSARR